MSIKYAVLGLLREEPMHGYRLKRAFDERVSALWGLTTAQVYQTLNALERRRLVQSQDERVGCRPARRIYSLTGAGRRVLDAWLDRAPATFLRPYRAETLVRLLFLRRGDVSHLGRALEQHEDAARRFHARVARARRDRQPGTSSVDVIGLFLEATALHLEADLAISVSVREALAAWHGRCDTPALQPNSAATRHG